MYNNPYMPYNNQTAIDRINTQMAELEKMREQLQKPIQQPTNLTQNFQIAPTNREIIKYANSMEEVSRDMVVGDTPYFSKDMSVVWIKNTKGEIKTYELNEIIPKDSKDMQIEYLQAQIEELRKEMKKYEPADIINEPITEPIESEEPTIVSTISKSKAKQKQPTRSSKWVDE